IERSLLASYQTTAITAEINCEAERAQQLAAYLRQQNQDRVQVLTIFGLVAGGVLSMVGGGLSVADQGVASGIAGLVGGALSTVFGTAALFPNQEYDFQHPRNLLRELWEGPNTPKLFPDLMWRFLNRPLEEDPTDTLRTAIVARWRQDNRLGTPGSAMEQRRIALLFGEGGRYNADDLFVRALMFDMLESQMALTSEYQEHFLRELLSRPTM